MLVHFVPTSFQDEHLYEDFFWETQDTTLYPTLAENPEEHLRILEEVMARKRLIFAYAQKYLTGGK